MKQRLLCNSRYKCCWCVASITYNQAYTIGSASKILWKSKGAHYKILSKNLETASCLELYELCKGKESTPISGTIYSPGACVMPWEFLEESKPVV